jgi:hypothetical protein
MLKDAAQKKIENLKMREEELRANFNAFIGGVRGLEELKKEEGMTEKEIEIIDKKISEYSQNKEITKNNLNNVVGALNALSEVYEYEEEE